MEVNNEVISKKHSICMCHVALSVNVSACNARE